MVVKIQASHARMEGTLSYNQRKVEKGVARVLSAVNLPSAFPGDIRRTFTRYENRNRTTDRVSFQMSINPAPSRPEERLSDAEVRDFAAALMAGLGYGSQPYVVYEHRDTGRTHYHVVSIRTDWEGKKIRDYREQYLCQRLLKENAQRFHYRIGEGEGRDRTVRTMARVFDPKAGDVRAQYISLFREAAGYRLASLSQLKAVLASKGLLLDTRDTPSGPDIILQGTDGGGKPVSLRISGRELGEDLYGLFEKRAKECRELPHVPRAEKARVARDVLSALNRSRNEEAFLSALARKGIHASVFRTREGDIYGATFVDSVSKTVLKGSELPGVTTKAYREADERWRASELREEARDLSPGIDQTFIPEEDPTRIPSYQEDRESDDVEETVVEEREDVVDVALGAAATILGKAGDFGAASRDDGKIYRKKKKKVIKRIR